MAVNLIYQMLVKMLSWMVLHARSDTAKAIEILVLRHQLAVLQRRTSRPRLNWSDRAVIAVLTRLLPARRRRGFLVTPTTILSWHRQLVRRQWTTPPVRPGRPAIPTGRALTVRLPPRIPPGDIAACMENLSDSATRSVPPPCGRFSTRRASPVSASDRADLVPVPSRAGTGDLGLRPVPPRHHHLAAALRVLRHRTRQPTRRVSTPPRRALRPCRCPGRRLGP
jgi:hypothetical protein